MNIPGTYLYLYQVQCSQCTPFIWLDMIVIINSLFNGYNIPSLKTLFDIFLVYTHVTSLWAMGPKPQLFSILMDVQHVQYKHGILIWADPLYICVWVEV